MEVDHCFSHPNWRKCCLASFQKSTQIVLVFVSVGNLNMGFEEAGIGFDEPK